ncbi:MAG: polyprenyl synthetase family protein [Bacteroidales bacterium]|nr:polyprenyl synthetase family protein [Bacteroidales bacterium]
MHTFKELQKMVNQQIVSQQLVHEPLELYEPIEYALSSGGKRLRPVLVLMAANLYTDHIEEALMPALGIEIFHNFTLLHDDIMDQAEIRRNQPTVHKKWNANVAILSGDAMFIKAYEYLLYYQGYNLQQVLKVFNETALKVCEGQQYDMNYETEEQVGEAAYLKMIGLKTAALIAGSLQIGALIGGAGEQEARRLYDFGWNLGVAFQLQDDYLDTFGNPEVFGKSIGGDILADKKTFLFVKAMEKAGADQKEELSSLVGNKELDPQEKIDSVKQLFRNLGVGDLTHIQAEQYYDKALREMDKVQRSPTRKAHLLDLADQMMRREK